MITVSNPEDLLPTQVGLIRVDPYTGYPVDEDGNWKTKQEGRSYRVFESEMEAIEFTKAELALNPMLEWSLVNSFGDQIAVLHNADALAIKFPAKKESVLSSLIAFIFGVGSMQNNGDGDR